MISKFCRGNISFFSAGVRLVSSLLLYAVMLLVVTGCAVFDKNRPGWDQFSPLASDNKLNLHVETIGEGKPVLLIHGFAANKYSWRYLAPQLARHNKIYLFDLKGFGESPKPDDGAYSIYDQAQIIIQFIKKNDLHDVVIVGHSFGGGVSLVTALYMTRSMPGRLHKLVLIDSIAYPQNVPFFIEILATPVLGPLIAHILPVTFQVNDVLETAYYNDDLITEKDINAYATPLDDSHAVSAMLATARAIWPSDLELFSANYQLINVPTKILWGREDTIVPPEIGQRLHSVIKNSTLDIIEQCGHIPHEECPGKSVPLIVDFIQQENSN